MDIKITSTPSENPKGDKFFNGKPCPRGHVSHRYSSTGQCVECLRLRDEDRDLYDATLRPWDGAYKAAKANGDKQYDGRPCKRCGGTRRFTCSTTCITCSAMWIRARKAKLKSENYEEYKARKRSNYHKYKEAMADNIKQWTKTAKERRPEYSSEYKKANPHKNREQAARRIAMKKQAVPPWETDSMRECIRDMYHLAAIMTNDKQKYEVDHIVPLNGKTVNGLHVPWNLWVITAEDNNKRPRNWTPCNLNNPEALSKNGLNDLPKILAYTG